MGELGGTAWAMNISTNLLLIFAFLAFVRGQPRSPRQDGSDQIEAAEETAELLTEEEVTPIDTSSLSSEDSSTSSKGSSTPEPEPEPEAETEPEPEGSGKPEPEGLEEPKPEDGEDVASPGPQPAPSKKCQKCSRSAFRARHGEFCDGCGPTSSSGEMEEDQEDQALEKDADRLRRKCRRCSIGKFAEKHENFCKIRCKDLLDNMSSTTSEPTPTPEPEHRPITSDDLKKKTKKKKKKDRKRGQKKANKKTDVQLPATDENISLEKPTEENLGPLGNLIKFLIQKNTFVR